MSRFEKIKEILVRYDVKPSYSQTAVYNASISSFRESLARRIIDAITSGEPGVNEIKDANPYTSLESRITIDKSRAWEEGVNWAIKELTKAEK